MNKSQIDREALIDWTALPAGQRKWTPVLQQQPAPAGKATSTNASGWNLIAVCWCVALLVVALVIVIDWSGSPRGRTYHVNDISSISVPSDLKASYSVIDLHSAGRGLVEITTKRDGPSGTTYARRLIDCRAATFKYLGTGDTLAEANQDRPEPTMSRLVDGSISYHVVVDACSRGGVR